MVEDQQGDQRTQYHVHPEQDHQELLPANRREKRIGVQTSSISASTAEAMIALMVRWMEEAFQRVISMKPEEAGGMNQVPGRSRTLSEKVLHLVHP
ncbi:MAG TPA: hypothetical protein VGD24_09495 [Gallionella sp.]